MRIPRRVIGLTLCALLALSVPTKAVPTFLIFEDFEASLRSIWQVYNTDSTLSRATSPVSPYGDTYVLKSVVTATIDAIKYGTYFYMSPWASQQGDTYMYEKAIEAGWTGGIYRAMEVWATTESAYDDPYTTPGVGSAFEQPAEFSLGTFVMAPQFKGMGGGNAQEAGGYHGYHSMLFPNPLDGGWIKYKMLRGGFRTNSTAPVARMVTATSNGLPFSAAETVNCSPSGTVGIFGNEYTHSSVNAVFLFTTVYETIPPATDTCTGASSGAQRTFSASALYNFGTFGETSADSIGPWTGYNGDWVNKGGFHRDWFVDFQATPKATYWDRVTSFYMSVGYLDPLSPPFTDYFSRLVLVADDRDDNVSFQNLAAKYYAGTGKLWFHFTHNTGMRGVAWEVRTSASDIHEIGWDNATPWESLTDCGCDYARMAIYETFTPPATNFYIAVKNPALDTFAQIYYDPDQGSAPPASGSTYTYRGRRVLVR